MSLISYRETRPWARSIKERVITRQMPPWHIDQGVGVQKFKNDMSLTTEQIGTIVSWVDGGALQGDPKDLPPARQWPDDHAAAVLLRGFRAEVEVTPAQRIWGDCVAGVARSRIDHSGRTGRRIDQRVARIRRLGDAVENLIETGDAESGVI